VRQPEYFAPPKSVGLKPVPAAAAYNNALRETSIRTSSIIQAVAQPVSPPDLGVADPPPQHLYSRRWHAAQRPYHTGGRTGPPHGAHPTHEFSRHQGNLLRGSRKTAGRKVLVNFPSGHAMSSRRLFLSGLLSSRARLRFAGLTILPNPKCSALPTTRFANPRHRKTIGTSTQLLAQWKANRGRIPTLESPDRCLKDRVHLRIHCCISLNDY
jgi:hypothetical protein